MNEPDEPPFERTICACNECCAHCRRQPAPLIPRDLKRIADALGLPVEVAARRYLVASPGAIVGRQTSHGMALARIGTIVPRMEDGKCVFLTDDGKCSIHAVSPFGCAYHDAHLPGEVATARSMWSLQQIVGDAGYARLRDSLDKAESWNPIVNKGVIR
jgi:hypothetical protein